MSKPVKEMMKQELVRRFQGTSSLAVVGFTGLDSVTTHQVRGRLRDKSVRMTVVKNAIARQAFRELGLGPAADLLEGPCAVAYGTDPDVGLVAIVRTLLEIGREAPQLTVKAALLEGEVFGPERIEELSRYPTRQEAVAKVVAMILSPGARLAGSLSGPGGVVASLLKTIQDRAKESSPGEASPAGEAPQAAPPAPGT